MGKEGIGGQLLWDAVKGIEGLEPTGTHIYT